MSEIFSRTQMMFGADALEILKSSHVAVFGIGGVGGFVVEALARAGVGTITLVDNDTVAPSNINRQIIALHSTVGRLKTDVMAERICDINPNATVIKKQVFFLPDTSKEFDFSTYDYVVDAIDTVTGKIELAVRCKEAAAPIISCMGTGNKINPTMLEVSDITKTSVCPQARILRKELKARGVERLKVVYSKELPLVPVITDDDKRKPASNSFVPSVAGLIVASEVIKDLISGVFPQESNK